MDDEQFNEKARRDGERLDELVKLEMEKEALMERLEEAKEQLRKNIELASELTEVPVDKGIDVENLRLLLKFNPSWTGCIEVGLEDEADRERIANMVAVHNNRAKTELVRITHK